VKLIHQTASLVLMSWLTSLPLPVKGRTLMLVAHLGVDPQLVKQTIEDAGFDVE